MCVAHAGNSTFRDYRFPGRLLHLHIVVDVAAHQPAVPPGCHAQSTFLVLGNFRWLNDRDWFLRRRQNALILPRGFGLFSRSRHMKSSDARFSSWLAYTS
jgi:hypothetical protein